MRSDISSSGSNITTWARQPAPDAMPGQGGLLNSLNIPLSNPIAISLNLTPEKTYKFLLYYTILTIPEFQWHPQAWGRWGSGGVGDGGGGGVRGATTWEELSLSSRRDMLAPEPGHLGASVHNFRQLASGEQWRTVRAHGGEKEGIRFLSN